MKSITINTAGKYLAIASLGILLQACGGSSSSDSSSSSDNSELLNKVDAANGVTNHTGEGKIVGLYNGKEVCRVTQNGKTVEETNVYEDEEISFYIDFDRKEIIFDEEDDDDRTKLLIGKGVYKFKYNYSGSDAESSWSGTEEAVFSINKENVVKLAITMQSKERYKKKIVSVEECVETGTMTGELQRYY